MELRNNRPERARLLSLTARFSGEGAGAEVTPTALAVYQVPRASVRKETAEAVERPTTGLVAPLKRGVTESQLTSSNIHSQAQIL